MPSNDLDVVVMVGHDCEHDVSGEDRLLVRKENTFTQSVLFCVDNLHNIG